MTGRKRRRHRDVNQGNDGRADLRGPRYSVLFLEAHDHDLAHSAGYTDEEVGRGIAGSVDVQHPEPVLDGPVTLMLIDDLEEAFLAVDRMLDHFQELLALRVAQQLKIPL